MKKILIILIFLLLPYSNLTAKKYSTKNVERKSTSEIIKKKKKNQKKRGRRKKSKKNKNVEESSEKNINNQRGEPTSLKVSLEKASSNTSEKKSTKENRKKKKKTSRKKRRAKESAAEFVETAEFSQKEISPLQKGATTPPEFLKFTEEEPINLGEFLQPWKTGDPNETIEFKFDNAELSNLIDYVAERYNLTFITDDIIKPLSRGGKSTVGAKISFKTNKPLSKKDAWSLFLTFLDMSGLTVTPGPNEKIYRITTIDPNSPMSATKKPLPTLIGVNPSMIPENDTYIRYVYFVGDASMDVIKNVLDKMRSSTTPNLITFPEVRAIIITDKAYNIRAMLRIVAELDQVSMPEKMSIIKLDHADADKIAKLYAELIQAESPQQQTLASRLMGSRKSQTLSHFSPGARVIPYPKNNVLIVLGTEEAVEKIKDFVNKIDRKSDLPYQPTFVYKLKNIEAEPIAEILSKVVQFQSDSIAAKTGGVRDGDKYFKPMSIVPEKSGNRLIITGDYEDYLKIYDVLQRLDVEQPQVVIDALIMNVDITDTREIGTQIRSKCGGLFDGNINFQTSGLRGSSSVVENTKTDSTGATRLLGNLIALASGGAVGSTYLTIGKDIMGMWGMFRLLNSYTHTTIVQTPFITLTNNYPGEISFGEKRRVKTGTTIGSTGEEFSWGDLEASMTLKVTPRISYEGFVTLDIEVQDNQFTGAESSGDRTEKEIKTSVIIADGDILALGGLIRNTFSEIETSVPLLGRIPGVGLFFKNKQKKKIKTSLLILIRPRIIPSEDDTIIENYTRAKLLDAGETIAASELKYKRHDPIHRWVFKDQLDEGREIIESFTEKEGRYLHPSQKKKQRKKKAQTKKLSDFI